MKNPEAGPGRLLVITLICAIPGIVLIAPLVYMISVGLGLQQSAMVMIIVVLLLGLLIPHLMLITESKRWLLPGSLVVIALGLIIAGSLQSDVNTNRPTQDNLFYGLDANSGKAVWGSADPTPDSWTSQFLVSGLSRGPLSEFFPLSTRRFLQSPAPAAELPGSDVKLLEESAKDKLRVVRLLVTSSRRASIVSLQVESNAEVQAVQINGKRIDYSAVRANGHKNWGMRYYAPPADGIELKLEITTGEPLKIRVVDQSYGLPEEALSSKQMRPANIIPAPYSFGDATLVSKSFAF